MKIMEFLRALKENNSLDWMHAHKAEYQSAMGEFEALLQKLILALGEDEPELLHLDPKKLTFRLNRDTRFSADKSPYNPSFRAHISPAGRAFLPVGYFLHLTPGGSFFGGGLFVPPPLGDLTTLVREYILEHGEEFQAILEDPAFAADYQLIGARLKNPPKGYPVDFPQIDLLKFKSFEIEGHFPDEALDDEEAFIRSAVEKFKLMRPFHAFLNTAAAGYRPPERK